MKPHAKTALSPALAIVGGMVADMRCDASEWVENSSQINQRVVAYTVKTYTGSAPFIPLAKYHLEELGLPMGVTDYELKKVLPTKAQLAKCVTDAERQIAVTSMGLERRQ